MTTRFAGVGGSDANNGTTWALRKATRAAVESLHAAGDRAICGPGVWSGQFTPGIAGSAGNYVEWYGDITGELTDGVGGPVIWTGGTSNIHNDYAYRKFTNILFHSGSSQAIYAYQNTALWLQSCQFQAHNQTITVDGSAASAWTIDDCEFIGTYYRDFAMGDIDLGGTTWTNNRFIGGSASNGARAIVGGRNAIARNNLFVGYESAIWTNSSTGTVITSENNLFLGVGYGNRNDGSGTRIASNYNRFWNVGTPNHNVTSGAQDVTSVPILFEPQIIEGGRSYRRPMPWSILAGSALLDVGGSSPPAVAAYGTPSPLGIAAAIGPVQQRNSWTRQSSVVRPGRTYAGMIPRRDFVDFEFRVRAGVAVTVSTYTRWDNNTNIGSKPRMELLGCGLDVAPADAVGTGGTFEQLVLTDTPTVNGIARARLWNRNTYTSDIAAYFDDPVVA